MRIFHVVQIMVVRAPCLKIAKKLLLFSFEYIPGPKGDFGFAKLISLHSLWRINYICSYTYIYLHTLGLEI